METIDCRGMQCPEPILRLATAARKLPGSGHLLVQADDDAFPLDVKSWCKSSGAILEELADDGGSYTARIHVRGKAPPKVLPKARGATHKTAIPGQLAVPDRSHRQETASWGEAVTTSEAAPRTDSSTVELSVMGEPTLVRRPQLDTAQSVSSAVESSFAASTTPGSALPARPKPGFELDLARVEDPLDLERRLGALGTVAAGMTARVSVASQSLAQTVLRWASRAGHSTVAMQGAGPVVIDLAVEDHVEEIAPFSTASAALVPAQQQTEADCALLVLHNDLEALLAAMLVANGAAAQGQRVVVFFTFWGLNLLRGDRPNQAAPVEKVSFIQRMFKWMMPKGPKRQKLGQMNFGGAGPMMLGGLMREKKIMELPTLIEQAEEQGVKFVACTMSMSVMGITKRDLEPRKNLAYGGVAYFVDAAKGAKMSLVF